MSTTDRITAAWHADRGYLTAIAARILSDPIDAEDVVQDAFARLAVQRVEEIEDLRAWLVVVVRRAALDRLGSAHRRLSSPSDPHTLVPLGGPDPHAPDPADRVTLDDEVRRALAVVLDQLSPAERAAFLLHDVFGVSFEGIAELVGRTPSACRQLASRARRTIRSSEPAAPRAAPDADLPAVADSFIAACAGGDLEALTRTLHPDVSGWATVNGRRVGFTEGVDAVAERVLLFLGPRSGWLLSPLPLEDSVAVLASRQGEPVAMLRLNISEDLIQSMHAVVLPG
jgi:RNA polymerase sigma-70 factor (ECF subfamily)